MKQQQQFLKLEAKQEKRMRKGRAEFHKLGQLLKIQLEEEKERKMKYKHKT